MALNIYFSVIGGSEISASITKCESQEEVRESLNEAGAENEKILAFISAEGDAAEALASIATCNHECEGSIGSLIEELLATTFSRGLSYGIQKILP